MMKKLYKRRQGDNALELKELTVGMFPDQDAFQSAVDEWIAEGWQETAPPDHHMELRKVLFFKDSSPYTGLRLVVFENGKPAKMIDPPYAQVGWHDPADEARWAKRMERAFRLPAITYNGSMGSWVPDQRMRNLNWKED